MGSEQNSSTYLRFSPGPMRWVDLLWSPLWLVCLMLPGMGRAETPLGVAAGIAAGSLLLGFAVVPLHRLRHRRSAVSFDMDRRTVVFERFHVRVGRMWPVRARVFECPFESVLGLEERAGFIKSMNSVRVITTEGEAIIPSTMHGWADLLVLLKHASHNSGGVPALRSSKARITPLLAILLSLLVIVVAAVVWANHLR